jgi:hypothetical protein
MDTHKLAATPVNRRMEQTKVIKIQTKQQANKSSRIHLTW